MCFRVRTHFQFHKRSIQSSPAIYVTLDASSYVQFQIYKSASALIIIKFVISSWWSQVGDLLLCPRFATVLSNDSILELKILLGMFFFWSLMLIISFHAIMGELTVTTLAQVLGSLETARERIRMKAKIVFLAIDQYWRVKQWNANLWEWDQSLSSTRRSKQGFSIGSPFNLFLRPETMF